MTYLTTQEITTHLGIEQITTISNGDNTLLQAAIDGAIAEAKGYLTQYDIQSELNNTANQRNALLLIFIKDIAVWHFVNICNVNTDLTLRRQRYDRAIDWLTAVQKGDVTADIKPLPIENKTGIIIANSNRKRNNHF